MVTLNIPFNSTFFTLQFTNVNELAGFIFLIKQEQKIPDYIPSFTDYLYDNNLTILNLDALIPELVNVAYLADDNLYQLGTNDIINTNNYDRIYLINFDGFGLFIMFKNNPLNELINVEDMVNGFYRFTNLKSINIIKIK